MKFLLIFLALPKAQRITPGHFIKPDNENTKHPLLYRRREKKKTKRTSHSQSGNAHHNHHQQRPTQCNRPTHHNPPLIVRSPSPSPKSIIKVPSSSVTSSSPTSRFAIFRGDATFFLGEDGLFGEDGFLGEAGLFKPLGAPASPPRTRCNSISTSRLLTSGKSQGEG
jgi:hypothetical protein